jgi:uncharacterized membrane protein YkoI
VKTLSIAIVSILSAAACGCGSSSKQPPTVPISLETARQTALAQIPGQVEEEELEEEDGKWVYEFDIRPPTVGAAKREISIDANTGAVVKIDDDDD